MRVLRSNGPPLLDSSYDPSIKVLENRELVSVIVERGEGVSS